MEVNAGFVRKLVFTFCALLATAAVELSAFAQSVEARIASVSGKAIRINRSTQFAAKRGDKLAPGDEIDTQGGGRVTVELTDGSLISVQPGSRVIFKDYRTVSSLRELIQVLLGRVRIKINHYGGKPNPYRVNSPSASILVRGTEFSVGVDATGDTSVVVYDGLVEVESLSDPTRRTLVSPGHGVLVKANEDLRFFTPGSGNEIGERSGRNLDNHQQLLNSTASTSITSGTIRNYVARDYERYVDSLVEPGESAPLLRFTAFSDSHLDSLENPAYATEFKRFESRTLAISSLSDSMRKTSTRLPLSPNSNSAEPIDAGYLVQNTFFLPLAQTRWVIGGNFAKSNSRVRAFSEQEVTGPITPLFPDGVPGLRTSKSSTHADSNGGSLMLARSFGQEGRTVIGIGVEYVKGLGELSGSTSLTNALGLRAAELIEAKSNIERTRFKLGLSHQFSNGHKLGIFYRHGLLSANDNDEMRTFNSLPLALDSVQYSSQSSEIGARLRGPLTRKLFYGAEAHWLTTGVRENINRSIIVEASERERVHRVAASFGLGYALRRQTVLSADVSAGVSRIRENYYERATGNPLERELARLRFLSVQAGAQTDLWRNLFASVSFFKVGQSRTEDHKLFPNRFGQVLDTNGFFVPDGITKERLSDNFADFGLGWRLTKSLLAEYVLATSYGQRAPNHIFLLRYTFKREE